LRRWLGRRWRDHDGRGERRIGGEWTQGIQALGAEKNKRGRVLTTQISFGEDDGIRKATQREIDDDGRHSSGGGVRAQVELARMKGSGGAGSP
jgi:hypothetical protein